MTTICGNVSMRKLSKDQKWGSHPLCLDHYASCVIKTVCYLLRWGCRCHPSCLTQLAAVLGVQTTLFCSLNVFRQQRCSTSILLAICMAFDGGKACPSHRVGWRGTVSRKVVIWPHSSQPPLSSRCHVNARHVMQQHESKR